MHPRATLQGGALFPACYNRPMTPAVTRILAIETSCDESAVALVEARLVDGEPVFATVADDLRSQAEMHAPFGGVFPSLAKREHAANLPAVLARVCGTATPERPAAHIAPDVLEQALSFLSREPGLADAMRELLSTIAKPNVSLLAVTTGPGLEPALWVGINLARALSLAWNIPLVGVNHMEGHVISALAVAAGDVVADVDVAISRDRFPFPSIALLISGGHTEIVLAREWGSYVLLGSTRDDAVGEAFDKVARVFGMSYPGGPKVSVAAQKERGRRDAGDAGEFGVKLPRPMLNSGNLDFSFSGLKTAVLYAARDLRAQRGLSDEDPLPERFVEELCFEFEEAVVDVLVAKVRRAIEGNAGRALVVGGGVIANSRIREALATLTHELAIPLLLPHHELATDNAVMIAMAGFLKARRSTPEIAPGLVADGNWSVESA